LSLVTAKRRLEFKYSLSRNLKVLNQFMKSLLIFNYRSKRKLRKDTILTTVKRDTPNKIILTALRSKTVVE
jgi:hypothetical protein